MTDEKDKSKDKNKDQSAEKSLLNEMTSASTAPVVDKDNVVDSDINNRLVALETERAEEASNDHLHTPVADDSEGLSDEEIEAQLSQAQQAYSEHQARLFTTPTAIESISAEALTLEKNDDEDEKEERACLNCSIPLQGQYCHNCGQPDRHFIRFFPKVLWHMINEAFDLDSKILRTLIPLLLFPGKLTMDYIAGRRARYVNPLRLYIILSVIFFVSVSLFKGGVQPLTVRIDEPINSGIDVRVKPVTTEKVDSQAKKKALLQSMKDKKSQGYPISSELITEIEASINNQNSNVLKRTKKGLVDEHGKINLTLENGKSWDVDRNPMPVFGWFNQETTRNINLFMWNVVLKLDKAINEDPSELVEGFFNVIPQLMFIFLPVFALLLKVTYIFKRRYYMEHLIVALHSHSFIFLSLLTLILLSSIEDALFEPAWLKATLNYLMIALMIWLPLNLFIMQKRIYAQGFFMTVTKFIFVGIAYSILLGFTSVTAFVLAAGS